MRPDALTSILYRACGVLGLLFMATAPAFGQVTVWFSPHDFGTVNVGQSSSPHWVRIENTSGSPLAITSAQSPGSPFAQTNTTCPAFPVTLQPFDICEFQYQFSPMSAGSFAQTLDVFWQAGAGSSGSVQIDLSGQGLAPVLDVQPVSGSLSFGDVDVGQSSAVEAFTLVNGGSLDVDISAIQHPAAPFAHVGGSCAVPPFTLGATQSCTLEYQFSPSSAGLQSDNVLVFANIPAGSVNLLVSGNGVATGSPQLSINPVLVDFGLVPVGPIAGPIDVVYENTGNLDLTISLMDSVLPPFFILSNGCGTPPFNLAPGGSCQINYTFAPASDGPAAQVIAIASNDPSPGGHAITLSGQAEHSLIDVVPGTVDFGSVPIGQPLVLPMDVINPGAHFDIAVFGPTGLGPLPPEFDIQPGSCGAFPVVLTPGNGCQLLVMFTPSAPGPVGHANMLNHDASAGSAGYMLTGTGVEDEVFADRFQP